MSEINVTSESTTQATGSITDQISALLMEEQSPQVETKVEKPKKPESKPDLPPSDDSQDEGSEAESEEDVDGNASEEETESTDEEVTWAKVLGVEDDKVILDDQGEFAGLKVKVDGKVEVVPIETLIAGFQSNKSNTNKSKAIAEERKALEVQKTEVLQSYAKKLQDAEALTTYLENSIVKEYSNVDWNTLRYQNPGEYAAMVQDYNMRIEEIGKIKGAIGTVRQEEQERLNAEQGGKVSEFVKTQIDKAIENNPEWTDPKKFKSALVGMQDFISETYGFTPQEFADVKDARILELIKDAQKYRSGKTVAEKKLAQPIAKYQKTAAKGKVPTKLEQLTKIAKSTSGYNKHRAETDAVAELLKNQGF